MLTWSFSGSGTTSFLSGKILAIGRMIVKQTLRLMPIVNWDRQLREGRAILAGGMGGEYWDNAAIIIFEAGSEAEAEEIVKNDPAVKAYVFQAQVRPFEVHIITNKFNLRRE